ncbi:GspH/FimT family pseudopilin [Hyphomicrobium sp. 99]|uniref:GspH/FimT family pseudopilin n=1 Tax=Hyphomicrobium sp. 99 TaxID=1163419 RepID=UPI0005F796A3|nr:GspH/FimT family pseudopilin [Hyphomicrobium sp. 99]
MTVIGRRGGGEGGFTLLELLVVLVILALAGAVAIPKTRNESSAMTLRSVATGLAAELRAARADAIRTGTNQSVTIDAEHRKYWTGENGRVHYVPAGIEISASIGKSGSMPLARVSFEPDGSSAGGNIFLKAGNKKADVMVDWMTGATQVERDF